MTTRLSPRYQTATIRRELRRKLRNVLGSSRDAAPEGAQAVCVAFLASKLIYEATNGKLDVLITHRDNCISEIEALKAVEDARYAPKPAGAVVLDVREQEALCAMLDHVPQYLLQRYPGTLDKIGYGPHTCDNCEGIDPASCMMNARV
jgi:hypothetical protein